MRSRPRRPAGPFRAALAALVPVFALVAGAAPAAAGEGGPGRLATLSPDAAGPALPAGAAPAAAKPGGAGDAAWLMGASGPRRVVSMNLCTDQLALLLAAPGQVVSVSYWAARPAASNLAERAAGLDHNRGGAEEIFLLRPDLVLAGSFTDRASVAMLRRLGIPVEIFEAADAVDLIPGQIRRMGRLLGREAEAERLVARFEAGLAAIADRHPAPGDRPQAAYHYANNYTSGAGTLAADVLRLAGFENAAEALGMTGARRIALETLVMARPFLVRTLPITGARRGRSYESGTHPALDRVIAEAGGAVLAQRWQVCATPFVLNAVAALAAERSAP